MNRWMAVPFALLAAVSFASSTVLKHRSSREVVDVRATGGRTWWAFVTQTARHPLWLGGLVADAAGLGLQVVALHLGGLVVVQPLLVSGLVVALVLQARGHLPRYELGWAGALVTSLAALVLLLGGSARGRPVAADGLPGAVAALVGLLLVATCVLLARRCADRQAAASALGAAVGLLYAAAAALITIVTDQAVHGAAAVFGHLEWLALAPVAVAGQVLNQLAFQSGALTASAPTITTVDVLASVLVGSIVFDEPVSDRWWHTLGAALALAVLLVSVYKLSRAEARSTANPAGSGAATNPDASRSR